MASLIHHCCTGRDATGHCDTFVGYKYAAGWVGGYDSATFYSGNFLRTGCSAGYQPLHEDNCGRCRWVQRFLYLDSFAGIIIGLIGLVLVIMLGKDLDNREECHNVDCNYGDCYRRCEGDKPPVGGFVVGVIMLVVGIIMLAGALWVRKGYFVSFVLSTKAQEILQSDKIMEKSPGVYWYKGRMLTSIPPSTS